MEKLIKSLLAVFLVNCFFSGVSFGLENTIYQKKLVKNRAEEYKDTGGVSPASRDLYIYADDKDIKESLDQVKKTPKAVKGEAVNIVSPVIDKKSKVRNVNIVLDAKKGIEVDKKRLGLDDNQQINIASPTISKGAKVRDVNITVDAKRKGIEIK